MEETRKDFIGQDVAIGDYIACVEGGTRNLIFAKVTKFTPKGVRAQYVNKKSWRGEDQSKVCFGQEFVKVDPEQALILRLEGKL